MLQDKKETKYLLLLAESKSVQIIFSRVVIVWLRSQRMVPAPKRVIILGTQKKETQYENSRSRSSSAESNVKRMSKFLALSWREGAKLRMEKTSSIFWPNLLIICLVLSKFYAFTIKSMHYISSG